MSKMNIFILAAGFGERLRPITDHIPKPLIPLAGKPVLQHVLERVSQLPHERIGINLHYKKELIHNWLAGCSFMNDAELFREKEILNTGGALKNAEALLRKGTFLVHNSDILSNMNLEKLIEHHRLSKNLVTLAVHDCPEFNNVIVDEQGFLLGISSAESQRKNTAFTGIAVYEPAFLDLLPEGPSSVVTAWLEAVDGGDRIGTHDVSGCYWSDIGTPSAYAKAVFDTLRNEGECIYVHPSTGTCSNIYVQGHAVIEEKCEFHEKVSLRNCIVLPGSTVGAIPEAGLREAGTTRFRGSLPHELPLHELNDNSLEFENCIIGPYYKIDLNESEILCIDGEGKELIGSGGSDRRYYRLRGNDATEVLMQSDPGDQDFERHIEYSRFFQSCSVHVPLLMDVRHKQRQAVFEDAGDMSLYSYLKCRRDEEKIEKVYRRAIDELIRIQSAATENVSACPLLQNRLFNYEHFRWETDYFIERFVKGIGNRRMQNYPGLEEELHSLALKADALPKTIVHRDFQSQNIMVLKGEDIRIIDYQGARMGPPGYDVASLLWDPYVRLDDGMKQHLLDYYMKQLRSRSKPEIHDSVRASLIPCRLQRHMQALGAYGFLSSIKGKKYFLKYVPEGLRLLKDDVHPVKDLYPELHSLIMSLE